MTCKDCKFYENECDSHFQQELMGQKRSMEICEIFYPKIIYIDRNSLIEDLEAAKNNNGMGASVASTLIRYVKRCPTVDAVEVVWKPILGFEGLYEISNLGKVRNNKGETLKQGIKRTNCTCYKLVNLWKDGRYYKKYVHRLIAEAFIPNPDNLPMVNHKDEDGTNNSIDNLEWCTREYNVNYGTAKERRAKKIRGVKHTEEHNKKISESMKRHFAKLDGDGK
jgi:hypothetical protein